MSKAVIAFCLLCVVLVSSAKTGGRIIGGNTAEPGQYPHLVAIFGTGDEIFCQGSLISDRWVLTSAGCANSAGELRVQLGSTSLSLEDPARVYSNTNYAVVHPDWNPDYYWNDIGLIRLDKPVQTNDYVKPISLYEGEAIGGDVSLTIAGWGKIADYFDPTDDDLFEIVSLLQVGQLKTISNEVCNDIYGGDVTSTELCVTGDGGSHPCYHDEGGPAMIADSDSNVSLAGVYSYGDFENCQDDKTSPHRYTRVTPYLKWITNITSINQ